MKETPVLGIDLGTTNSVVAVADSDDVRVLTSARGEKLVPSVVSFHPNGEVLVGSAARERRLLDSRNTIYSVKRLIGRPFDSEEVRRARSRFAFDFVPSPSGGVLVEARNETYTLSEISAFVLREVRAVAEASLGMPTTKAVITVPANFNELQRSATKAAGRVAGLEVLRILNEPTAAALAYGYGRGSRERIAIFDLGGGTFDVTILELAGEVFEVRATAGDTYLGGDDIDSLVAEQMAEAFLAHHRYDPRDDRQAYERLRAAAEWAKCQLSLEEEVQLRVEELAYGEGGISLDLTFALGRSALEAMAMPLLSRAFDVCEDVMRVAGLRPTQIDNVVLVGGSTRMPLVHRMVQDYFGMEPLSDIDPDLVVAQGAAIQGRALATSRARSRIGRVALRRDRNDALPDIQEVQTTAYDPRAAGTPPPPPDLMVGPGFDEDEPTELRPEGARSQPPAPRPTHRPKGPGRPPPLPPALTMPKPTAQATGLPPLPPQAQPIVPQRMMSVGVGAAPAFDDLPTRNDVPRSVPPPAHVQSDALSEAESDALSWETSPTEANRGADRAESEGMMAGLPGWDDLDAPPDFPSHVRTELDAPRPPLPEMAPPLLLDVTPLSLGVETVGGFCEPIIRRNAAIPTEQTRMFSTARDGQQEVVVRICQGESRNIAENQLLGTVELKLNAGRRGENPIEVTFMLDADGTLAARARDTTTGVEQSIRVNLIGAVDEGEMQGMQQRVDQMYRG